MSLALISVLGVTVNFDPAAACRRSAPFSLSAGSFARCSQRRRHLISSLTATSEVHLLFLSPPAPVFRPTRVSRQTADGRRTIYCLFSDVDGTISLGFSLVKVPRPGLSRCSRVRFSSKSTPWNCVRGRLSGANSAECS